jgi:hypothetical protein
MTNETKQQLFPWVFAGAALFYGWAVISLWLGPSWGFSGGFYMVVGVMPAFFGVLLTVAALLLHMDIQENDSSGRRSDF